MLIGQRCNKEPDTAGTTVGVSSAHHAVACANEWSSHRWIQWLPKRAALARRTKTGLWCAFSVLMIVLTAPATAESTSTATADAPIEQERYNTGWSLYLDNDAFTLVNRDQQYTGGFALTLSGRRAVEYPVSIDSALGSMNELTGFSSLTARGPSTTRHSIEFGMTSFTPDRIEESEPIRDDHPYAGLVFMSNTRQTVLLEDRVSYLSMLAIGLLGTDIPKGIQNAFHELNGDQKPQGWDNQISDGGEPTFNYVVDRQESHWIDNDHRGLHYDVRSTIGASVGYTTQVWVGLNWRWGKIRTPWWGFNPDFAEYINLGTPVAHSSEGSRQPRELFLWGSLQLRQRFYNALLEGQFRDSEVTFDRSDLRSTLGEAAIGLTWGLENGMRVTGALRARTPKIRNGAGLDPVWGSIVISRAF